MMAEGLTFSAVVAGVLCAVLMPADANGFNTEHGRRAAAAARSGDQTVMIFDNAYLDRRFGRTRVTESGPVDDDRSLSADAGVIGLGAGSPEIAPHSSLLKGITPKTPPRRAAALRLAEHGRKALQSQQYRKSIYYLEKALGIDASPFVHFYLARAHYQLADHQRALEFLEVAESAFAGHAPWLPELAALRRALSAAPVARQQSPRRNIGWAIKD